MHNLIRHSCEVYHLIPYIVVARELLPYNTNALACFCFLVASRWSSTRQFSTVGVMVVDHIISQLASNSLAAEN